MLWRKHPYFYLPVVSRIYRAMRRLIRGAAYAGWEVECPLCERRFRCWVGGEDSGTCPGCESFSRHRMLWLYVRDACERFQRPCRVLYFAPDPCSDRLRRLSEVVCTTTDISDQAADVRADITRLPFAPGTFDMVICSHVLEHVVGDRAAMRELFTVLRQGGEAFVQVPINRDSTPTDEAPEVIDPGERERRFGQFDHVRRYGLDIVDRLEAAGFVAQVVAPVEQMDPRMARRYGLWNDVIIHCRKPERSHADECLHSRSSHGVLDPALIATGA